MPEYRRKAFQFDTLQHKFNAKKISKYGLKTIVEKPKMDTENMTVPNSQSKRIISEMEEGGWKVVINGGNRGNHGWRHLKFQRLKDES